jgi:hypothetical protein
MINAPNRLFDGMFSFAGGMDAGRNPVLLAEDQCQEIENAICRGGKLTTRPAFREMTLNFTNNITYDDHGGHGGANPIGTQDAFHNGLFQCACYYDPSLDTEMFVVSIGGRLFTVVPHGTNADVTELYLDKQNRDNISISYMVQADRFLIVQDGENTPIIFDGVTARRALANEIFTGTEMAYGLGRIVLIGKNKRDIYFGDLYGSHEGEPGLSVLQFTETTFLSEGGAASLPFTMGHATGLIFFPEQDTTMGQGQLLIFAEKGMASFFLDLPREQWKTSKFQAMALIDIGGTGHRTLTPVNSDIWFRSTDGWRTYRQARAEAKGWFQLPLSTEVSNFVDVETPTLLYLASSIHFDNRLITTCTPVPNQGKPYHNGFLSLDFDVLSSFGQAAHKPSWDGHWSGLKTLQLVEGMFAGQHRAFAFGLDDGGLNAFYEIDPVSTKDTSGPITSYVVPKSFTFQEYFNEGKLNGGDIWFDNIRENTTAQVWFKPDDYPEWLPWMTSDQDPIQQLTPIGIAGQISGGTPTLREGFSPRRSLIKPQADTDPTTKRDLKRFYEVHQKIQWTGNASINRIRLAQDKETEKVKATR